TVDLRLDIYQPENDTLSGRPLIILAFGGSFTFGFRTSPDIVQLCNEFAARGYVTASIDYRLGFENGNDSDTNQLKALFRGIQDLQAAIRFFYKDRQTDNNFRIDTTQIFIGGTSAGAFISLNHAYYRETIFSNPPPPWVVPALNEIHWFDGNSGNPGYSTKVKGVINLCGALADTLWLQPGDPIIVSVHGTADDLVPYKYDSAQAAVSTEAKLYGSYDIHQRANHIGLANSLKLFSGAGHAPFIFPKDFTPAALAAVPLYMDTTIGVIRDFLYANIERKDLNTFALNTSGTDGEIDVYPNPAADFMWVEVANLRVQKIQLSLTDILGREIMVSENNTGTKFLLRKSELGAGIFFLQTKPPSVSHLPRIRKIIFQ
ncbi:MAG TPA: T9SS type A sorting domain-containing protein, partial [Chitinophagales bacterium]|nr:T9SS type A sorting domain-containing protein [Chitinophagales bacterium]